MPRGRPRTRPWVDKVKLAKEREILIEKVEEIMKERKAKGWDE